jgi:hypothetical protein
MKYGPVNIPPNPQELNRDHYVERETYAQSRAGIDSMLIDSQKRLEDEIENHRGE